MKNPVTMKHVAKVVGVHVSTVSRALNPASDHPISPEIIDRVQRASRKLGFRVNAAGYSLKTNRTRLVGVVVPDITDPVFPPIIRGLEDGLGRHGYAAILANTDGNARKEIEIAEIMRARGVDGLALASIKYHDKLIKKAGLDGLPLVTVGRHTDDPNVSRVVHDEDDGFRRILDHLVSFGHRHIAYIAGPQNISTGRNRYRAIEHHRKQMSLAAQRQLVVFARSFNEHEGERCTEELLARSRDFTALVCANDRLAVGAIAALRRHGLNCPEDISVTGFNDMSMVDRLIPPLTTIRIQQYRVGYEAAEILVEAMELPPGDRKPRQVVLPVELIVRQSTRPIVSQHAWQAD